MGRRLRVAFILPSFAGGGAERVLLTLLGSLDQEKFDVRLVVLDGKGPLVGDVPPSVRFVDLRRRRLRLALVALTRQLRTAPADIVVSTIGYMNLALLGLSKLLPTGSRIIVREANAPQVTIDAFSLRWLARLGYRHLYRRAKTVLCPTSEIRAALQGACSVPTPHFTLLPNPVDEDRLRQRAASPARHPGDGPRFVTAGRFTHQKGLDRLVDMFSSLRNPKAHLTILGDGPERSSVKALIEVHQLADRISLPGFVQEPWPYYSGSDAFLLTSRWEGMPNVALEALAVGVPVIATPECGGVNELTAETEPGAVTIAEIGDPYIDALDRVRPRIPGVGPSLLPRRFDRKAVAQQFSNILLDP